MTFTYNPILVLVSVLVAIAGAYACFDLVIRVQRTTSSKRRKWLALAALAIGGSIWAMHFIAMLAVQIPGMMQHDILITLISGLVSILMTAAALAIVSEGVVSLRRIVIGGVVMGAGITAMHYVGMSGMRGNFAITYELRWLLISILVGIFASTLSLWLVMGLQLRGVLRRLLSAMVMGFSIAGVHYSGMFGTKFSPIEQLADFTQPILSPFSLGLITALVTFGIIGWTLLILLPTAVAEPVQTISKEHQPKENQSKETQTPQTHSALLSATLLSATLPTATTPTETFTVEAQRLDSTSKNENEPASARHTHSNTQVATASSDSVDVTDENITTDIIAGNIPVLRNKKTFFLQINDIASISADGHYTTVRTTDGQSHFCNVAFNKLLEDIPALTLTRVHRSHAINLKSVVSFQRKRDKAVVNLGSDEHEVPVSRTHVLMLQNALGLGK